MAILAGFKDVKEGALYDGQRVDYISIDTKGRYHLHQSKGVLNAPYLVAAFDVKGDALTSWCAPYDTDAQQWISENVIDR